MDLNPDEFYRQSHNLSSMQPGQEQRQQRGFQGNSNQHEMAIAHISSYFSPNDSDEDFDNRPVIRPTINQNKIEMKNENNQQCYSEKFKIFRPLNSKAPRILRDREYGKFHSNKKHLKFYSEDLTDFVSQHLPSILKEKEFKVGTINKIFASKWINSSHVVMGTKCNKLLVLDVRNNKIIHIQSLKSTKKSIPAECPCGIHGIAINPSRTMLATGANNTNDLAVYELPTFDPLCVGQRAHKDWIFDMDWVDDQHVITGSRDSSLALWCVDTQKPSSESTAADDIPKYRVLSPHATKLCKEANRVRALSIGRRRNLLGVVSMNAKFHIWDIQTFCQLDTYDLQWKRENVCVTSSEDLGLFAVGSQAYVTMIDQRAKCNELKSRYFIVPQRLGERGVRSLSFNQNIISIGTGDGRMLFYDLKMSRYLYDDCSDRNEIIIGSGWLRKDDNYREHFMQAAYPNAIYTHCYDEDRARLFVAGGPLPAGLYGNYAGLLY